MNHNLGEKIRRGITSLHWERLRRLFVREPSSMKCATANPYIAAQHSRELQEAAMKGLEADNQEIDDAGEDLPMK